MVKYHEVLIDRNHIYCNSDGIGEHNITLLKDGKTAYFEEAYLIEGRKIFNDNIYDKSKWLIPIISLAISLLALYFSLKKS